MKILYVGTLPPHPGGSAILAFQLLDGFAAAGHSVRAIAGITASALRGGDAFATAHPRIRVERFDIPFFEYSPDQNPPSGYRAREGEQIRPLVERAIRDERPDVLVIGRETFAWHLGDPGRRDDVPAVLLVQGAALYGICSAALPREVAAHMLGEFHKVDRLVTVAAHLEQTMRELRLDRCVAIPNPVDLEKFRPA